MTCAHFPFAVTVTKSYDAGFALRVFINIFRTVASFAVHCLTLSVLKYKGFISWEMLVVFLLHSAATVLVLFFFSSHWNDTVCPHGMRYWETLTKMFILAGIAAETKHTAMIMCYCPVSLSLSLWVVPSALSDGENTETLMSSWLIHEKLKPYRKTLQYF